MRNSIIEQDIINDKALLKKMQLTGLLELVCQELELTETQFNTARDRYEAVGRWLGDAPLPLLQKSFIYPHGSIALGTMTRPIHRNEYDIDLVCLMQAQPHASPAEIKKIVGDRLHSNATYRPLLEEKKRCWRLNYANEFHMDITPAIMNPVCVQGGELVPDKQLRRWKETNPRGYKKWFDECGKITIQVREALAKTPRPTFDAAIESLPVPVAFKGALRRCVQLAKRHRDMWFSQRDDAHVPISIIITTLLAKSYAYCATHYVYETEYDAVIDVIRRMPLFMEVTAEAPPAQHYCLWNPTTQKENFAEKWNEDERHALAFFEWHKALVEDFEHIMNIEGLDQIGKRFAASFGPNISKRALTVFNERMSVARADKKLAVLPRIGILSAAASVAGSVPVRANTFFGA